MIDGKIYLRKNCCFFAIILLSVVLGGCGSGSTEDILCGGEPCSTNPPDSDNPDPDPSGPPSSIQFVSAVPSYISIQSAGGDETSVVTFLITDLTGNPSRNVSVSFALSTTKGGISLSPSSDRTNDEGVVAVVVKSGTAKAAVTVRATIDATQEFTISPALAVTTGIPDTNSFSVSASVFNPPAFRRDGETVTFTARMADVFNNPPPDNTVVSFYAESGKIEGGCTSINGACSVTWTSQGERPIEGSRGRVGRVAILAYTGGAESFNDNNSNGVFDDNDEFLPKHDQAEPWADFNENGQYDYGEYYDDFNHNGVRDSADGLYNGPLCTHSSLCSPSKITGIGSQHLIVMSSDVPEIVSPDLDADLNEPGDRGQVLNIGAGRSYQVSIGDENGNSLPSGTKIKVSTSYGKVELGDSIDVLNTYEPVVFTIRLVPGGGNSTQGYMTVSITTQNSSGTKTTKIKYRVSA